METDWRQHTKIHKAFGTEEYYVCYHHKHIRLRLTHRGTWHADDMDIYWHSISEAQERLKEARSPLTEESPHAN